MTASVTTTDEIAAEERKKQVHQQIITCIQKADTTAFRHLLDIIVRVHLTYGTSHRLDQLFFIDTGNILNFE